MRDIDPYWRIAPLWQGETVAILAGGPSLTQEQVDYCRGKARVIAINNSHELAPWADALYFCDDRWFKWYEAKARAFAGWKITLENIPLVKQYPELMTLRNAGQAGFSEHRNAIYTGSNSGYQAIHIAAHLGAARIVLLGYDMGFKGGRSHWHKGHPINPCEGTYQSMLPHFPALVAPLKQRGIDIINATPSSALHCFRKQDLQCTLIASSESNRTTAAMLSSPA